MKYLPIRWINRRLRNSLMNGSLSVSLVLSICIILAVQSVSVYLLFVLNRQDIDLQSKVTADEIALILREPLYNVEDAQVALIADALVSSGRIAGIHIHSTATGTVYEKMAANSPRWIRPQTRRIEYRDIYLGDVSIQYSEREFIQTVRVFSYFTIALIIMVLLSNVMVISFILRKKVKGVFGAIEKGIQEIRAGHYTYRIPESGYRDMDVIIDLLNDMSGNIREKNSQLMDLNVSLEARVVERTSELETSLAEQRLLQDRLVEAGKLSVVGQLSAGIAHEFNTPLGAIISSNHTLIDFLDGDYIRQLDFYIDLTAPERKLYLNTLMLGFQANQTLDLVLYTRKQKKEAAEALSEKGIRDAERITEILADIYLLEKLDVIGPLLGTDRDLEIITAASGTAVIRRLAEIVSESGRKASSVVSALRSYLASETGETGIIELDKEINRVLTLMHNMLKHGIDIHTELLPVRALGTVDTFDQVLLNIIRNAAQAMDFKGNLTLRTSAMNGYARVSIIDSGPGIPEELQERIFEPFFTTRKHDAGMGLGLDICRRIIEESDGHLDVLSRPGRTEFTITLPAYKEEVE